MLAMPLTFSIAEGIALGFIVYVAFNVFIGRARQVTPLAYVLAGLFLAHLIYR
jgi:AGZA family xanthine/uracil permease-like MFS transporter